ncbi:FliC/FljB family flagellin [Serratia symbiotica]|uniref:FliC/FljB family flagellin n=1 Tax=Serratia symbiotica TaxID=138074 RepID=UPI001DB7EF2C|nr:FliC/FljB family flagellin [Serratia symbiotica]NIG88381.1 FliC/FljB family flagellin [Serratia symbiotica]USS96342.1 FliC/FljB family flagellin [Serratia symbiotica]
MAQVINTNSLSLMAQNNLNKSQASLGTAIERLSSGLRINSARDDAAGQAISNRFTANILGLSQASRNANDGISLAQTTEGALNEVNDNLQNIRRLAVQSQNGTNSESDRKSLQAEIDQRLFEINRISAQTEFNGVKVLSKDQSLAMQVGANDGETIRIDLKKLDTAKLGLEKLDLVAKGPTVAQEVQKGEELRVKDASGADTTVKYDHGTAFANDNDKDNKKTLVHGTDKDGNVTYYVKTTEPAKTDGNEDPSKPPVITYHVAKIASDGKVTEGDPLDAKDIHNPMKSVDDALTQVDSLRSSLGAVQNRFASVINNLNSAVNNLSASRSRILDADYSTEVSNMSRANILQQAGTSVLAQANQSTQNVLSLLR